MTPVTAQRRRLLLGAAAVPLASFGSPAAAQACELWRPAPERTTGRTLQVGPQRELRTLASAAKAARDGDVIELDAGDFVGDVALFTQNALVIRGAGGRARLVANGAHAEGKAILVLRAGRVRIENVGFFGARVPDRNGAGIRFETGQLTLVDCHFEDNENGILTSANADAELDLHGCTFVDNGAGDGRTHNLYVGPIRRLRVIGCYSGRARVGHLLKSRARENQVLYSRLTGETGTSSYELEFPNGGRNQVLGCLIQQGPASENSTLVSIGAEGYVGDEHALQFAFNTVVNELGRPGIFLRVAPGKADVQIAHSLQVGAGRTEVPAGATGALQSADRGDFTSPAQFDYRLRARSHLVGSAGAWRDQGDLRPTFEYRHAAQACALGAFTALTPVSPGAFQRLGA